MQTQQLGSMNLGPGGRPSPQQAPSFAMQAGTVTATQNGMGIDINSIMGLMITMMIVVMMMKMMTGAMAGVSGTI